MRITVFGGSAPKPGERAYQQAYRLGQLLGQSNHTVLTGGYIGTMEAVSRGARETGGYVIGVTCDEIENWRPVLPNRWINEEKRYHSLRERMFVLMEECDAAMALAGGAGTLAEISTMWNHMQTNALSNKPLILIGEAWRLVLINTYDALSDYFPAYVRQLLYFTADAESAVSLFNDLTLKRSDQ